MKYSYPVISADSHVIEPPDTWTDRVERKHRDRTPHIVRGPERDTWVCEDVDLLNVGTMASAGKRSEDLAALRARGRFETSIPRGSYIAKERLPDMAEDGVDAEVVYPTLTMRLYGLQDLDLQAALFDAYNRWLVEYCAGLPDRLKGIGVISLRSVEQAVGELHRVKELGLAGAMIGISPEDETEYGRPAMDPFWRTAQDLGLPLSLHILTEKKQAKGRNLSAAISDCMYVQRTVGNMVAFGVFQRFPKLKVISAESDSGWAPYFMERLDYLVERRRSIYNINYTSDRKPSEWVKSNLWLTFMRDRSGVEMRHHIGTDKLMWSSDYPHGDSTWPDSRKILAYLFEGVPDADRRKIVYENVKQLYGFNGVTPL